MTLNQRHNIEDNKAYELRALLINPCHSIDIEYSIQNTNASDYKGSYG